MNKKFIDILEFEKKYDIIKKECSDICQIYDNNVGFLYRGIKIKKFDDDSILKIQPRNDRKPVNTLKKIQYLFDEEFEKIFGWKPREQGVFCTGCITDASIYGYKTFIIFPKNGFKFIWSKFINDLFSDLNTGDIYKIREMVLTYQSSDIKSAIKSYNEIMIKCEYYYAIDTEYIFLL